MKKFLVLFSLIFPSCYVFNNPVDPKSPQYVGYPVEMGVNLTAFTKEDYGALNYPALSWHGIEGSTYFIEISQDKNFSFSSGSYSAIFPYPQFMKADTFTRQQGWFIAYDSLYLDSLPVGRNYARVSVANSFTGNEFRTWSKTTQFIQKLKQIKVGWKDDSRYFLYSYSNDGRFKKEDSYYLFSSTTGEKEHRYLESILYEYNEKNQLINEFVYKEKNLHPQDYSFHYNYLTSTYDDNHSSQKFQRVDKYKITSLEEENPHDFSTWVESELRIAENGNVKKIQYFSLKPNVSIDLTITDEIEFLEKHFHVLKERIYTINEKGEVLSIRENRYNSSANEEDPQTLSDYFIFRISGQAIVQGEYYDKNGQLNYTYRVTYYDQEKNYPKGALYTFTSGEPSQEYLYQYNFPSTNNEIEIQMKVEKIPTKENEKPTSPEIELF